jgi:Spy/CpxP family protein refolding chaperone
MKSARFLFLAVGAAFLLGVTALVAQHMHGQGGLDAHFEHMLSMYTEKLDLSSTQQEQIKAVWAKEKPTLQPLMQQMRQNHEAMKALEASGTFDEAKTRAVATQNAQVMIEMQVQHARIKSEMMQVLTTDQKTKFQQLESEHHGHMGGHMGAPPED